MDCICVYTAHIQSIDIQCIYSSHTVDRHTVYILGECRDQQARLRGLASAAGEVFSEQLQHEFCQVCSSRGVTPCPLRGAAPPNASPRQEFVLEICGGPGGFSGGGGFSGAGRRSRRCGAAGADHQCRLITRVNHVSELGEVLHAR